MDLKVGRVLAREFARSLASEVATRSLEQTIRSARPNEEHKALGPATSGLLREFLATHGLNPESAMVDWEGNAQRKGLQQQSYPLLGTWTHPDLAVVAPFTVAVEIDREGDTWVGYKQALMKAACHVLSGSYDAVVHIFVLKYADSSQGIYLQDSDESTTFRGDKPNAFTRQLMANLNAQGVVTAFVPAGPGAPTAEKGDRDRE